ncbi:MAG: hypothetical protein DRI79_11250 [Chloroflexi bacterium]|nr:MAG: hypothetical protein DRI79_11250 [Chloroflexota bacterium]
MTLEEGQRGKIARIRSLFPLLRSHEVMRRQAERVAMMRESEKSERKRSKPCGNRAFSRMTWDFVDFAMRHCGFFERLGGRWRPKSCQSHVKVML